MGKNLYATGKEMRREGGGGETGKGEEGGKEKEKTSLYKVKTVEKRTLVRLILPVVAF